MIALWKMGTPDSYRPICDRFNVGKATALRAVRRVTGALFKQASRFIQWPSGDHVGVVIRGFEEASGFPKTIGAIDGTHILTPLKKMQLITIIEKGFTLSNFRPFATVDVLLHIVLRDILDRFMTNECSGYQKSRSS